MNSKPASVLVISIIGIVTSGLSLLFAPCGIFMFFKPLTPNPIMDAMMKDPGYVAITLVSFAFSLLMSILLLALSISSLKLKPWARRGMMAYAWIMIVYAVLSLIPTYGYVLPKMSAVIAANPALKSAGSIAITAGAVTGILAALYVMAFPVAILICFRRTVVVNAFNGIFPAAPTDFPVEYPGQPPMG